MYLMYLFKYKPESRETFVGLFKYFWSKFIKLLQFGTASKHLMRVNVNIGFSWFIRKVAILISMFVNIWKAKHAQEKFFNIRKYLHTIYFLSVTVWLEQISWSPNLLNLQSEMVTFIQSIPNSKLIVILGKASKIKKKW